MYRRSRRRSCATASYSISTPMPTARPRRRWSTPSSRESRQKLLPRRAITMVKAPLLSREFLEKLERLTIQWQKSFPGLVGGHNLSRLAGAGQEFLDHRNFHHGDDLRSVNWRAYLRLEKLF